MHFCAWHLPQKAALGLTGFVLPCVVPTRFGLISISSASAGSLQKRAAFARCSGVVASRTSSASDVRLSNAQGVDTLFAGDFCVCRRRVCRCGDPSPSKPMPPAAAPTAPLEDEAPPPPPLPRPPATPSGRPHHSRCHRGRQYSQPLPDHQHVPNSRFRPDDNTQACKLLLA